MRLLVLALPLAAAACTPRAVSPPTRTFALASPNAPVEGASDVQLGAARIGTIWGPELVGGDTRVRHAVSRGAVIEADAGVLHVLNDGMGGNRNAFTGRLGLMLRPPEWETHDVRIGMTIGAGGGYAPEAGSWGAFDVGVVLAGSHRWVRPVVGAGGGLARPFGDTTFEVVEPGEPGEPGKPYTLQLPRNLTAHAAAGVELGPPDRTVMLGASMTRFWLQEPSILSATEENEDDDLYFAVGGAIRFALD